jgi:hypothetical protein
MKRLVLTAAAVAASLLAGQAGATMRLVTNNMVPQASAAAAFVPLDLNGGIAGSQSILTFTTAGLSSVTRLLFNAECALGGTTNLAAYVDIDVRVKRAGATAFVTLPPTVNDNAFCSANSTLATDGRVSSSVQAYITLPAGTHQVQVLARPVGGGTWSIDDLSLVIDTE